MFVSSKKYNQLKSDIKQAAARNATGAVSAVYKPSEPVIYIAEVDMEEGINPSVTPFNGVYKYEAKLYYKQFSAIKDSANYERDAELGQYKAASSNVTLLSSIDLSAFVDEEAELQTVVVPCINKGSYFESLLITGFVPDNSIDNANYGKSIGYRTYTDEVVTYKAEELLGFFRGLIVPDKLEDLLESDPSTGEISGKNADKYKLLVRVDDGTERPRLSYMRIHPVDTPGGDDDDEESSIECGTGGFPGTLPGDDDTGGAFPGNEEEEEDTFPGDIGDGTEFPGKTDDCW